MLAVGTVDARVRASVRACVCMCVKGKGYKLHDYDLRQKNPYICVKQRTFCSYVKIFQKCFFFLFFFFLKKEQKNLIMCCIKSLWSLEQQLMH